MLLHRLEVWNWRGLDHAVIQELASDLNLIVGPNESGKSRLFEALRFALFEKYKGDSEEKKKLRTWGGSESPTVEVDFETGGHRWKLHKRFLKGALAKLEGSGQTWTDDDAENELRRLWRTKTNEVKGRKDFEQYLGLWPLLWVQQGRAGTAPHEDLNTDTRVRLSDALSVGVEEVTTGRVGQRILDRAENERGRYWTSTWKERGELDAAQKRREAATHALNQAKARREQAHAAADELTELTQLLAESETKLVAQKAEVEGMNARVAEASERAATLRTRELEAKKLHADRALVQQRERERGQLEADMKAAQAEISEREAHLAKLDERAAALDLERAATRVNAEAAEELESRAKAANTRAVGRERQAAIAVQLEGTRQSLREAMAHRDRLRAIEEELRPLRTGKKEIERLRRLREAWARANAALTAAAARVTLRALRPLVIDGEPLEEGRERGFRVDESTSILIEGIAELHVSPAGAELHRLRDTERDAEQHLHAALAELGAASLAEAEEHHGRRTELEAERKHPSAFLEQLGVGGTPRLEATVRALEAELEALSEGAMEESVTREPSVAEARTALSKAEEIKGAARAARDVVEQDVARIAGERQVVRTLLEDARSRCAATSARLESFMVGVRVMGGVGGATEALQAADAAWTKAEALVEALRSELRRRGDLDAETDGERANKALAQLEALQRTRRDRAIQLEAIVRHFGAEAIHEEVLQAEGELDQAVRELDRTTRRAGAARALVLALTTAQREVQERLVAPVREKVEPYLEGLLPGAHLAMGEGFTVDGLQVGDHPEPFDALSGGTKEQVSLLVRLGLAEVLGQGEPLPIVLDDCLVNTDPARQEDMLRILYRASKKQQIVLFSCHGFAFERLGATRRYDLPARRAR